MISKDVIIIGAGGAGLTAAFGSSWFKSDTLIIERAKTGGECTWNGCIPSKALIHLAELRHSAIQSGAEPPATSDVFAKVDKVRNDVYAHETPEVLAERGVDTLIGEAKFIDEKTVAVGDETYTAKMFFLAVGSKPLVPPVPGLAETPHLTNETVFDLQDVPKSLLVMGGGPIGLEMAQAMSRLGSKVTVVEMVDRILFREDPDCAQVIHDALEGEGVVLRTGAKAVAARGEEKGVVLTIEEAGKTEELSAEALLVAVGRGSATEGLGLDAAGIETTPKGVKVDDQLRTTNPRVWAVGDVAGPYAFSHMAEYQGMLACVNAHTPMKRKADYRHVAWATFTDPEIARAGMLEEEARAAAGKGVKVYTHRYEDLDRGRTAPGTKGLVKVILDRRGRILGAHVAGPRAGELIGEIQVLKTLGIPYHKLRGVIHPYPTYADILRQIAKKVALERFNASLVAKVLRLFNGSKSGD